MRGLGTLVLLGLSGACTPVQRSDEVREEPPAADERPSGRPGWHLDPEEHATVAVTGAAWTRSRNGKPLPVLRVDALVRFEEAPAVRSSVFAKASCRVGDHVLVSVAELRDDDWLLYEITDTRVGTDIPVYVELFRGEGLQDAAPCQLEFRVVPFEVGPMQRILPRRCILGGRITSGACPGLVDVPTEDDPRFAVHDWEWRVDSFHFVVTAGERFSRRHEVELQLDCVGRPLERFRSWKEWQWLDPGESYAIDVPSGRTGPCTLTVARATRGHDSELLDPVEIGSACVAAGRLGACP